MNDSARSDKGPWVKDLKPGSRFVGVFLARDATLESFRQPSRGNYLRLNLRDRTGWLPARLWENPERMACLLEKPTAVKLEGEVEMYRQRPQVRILRIRVAKEDEYDLAELIPFTERDLDAMMKAVDAEVTALEDPHLSALVRSFYADPDFRHRFAEAPASLHLHHPYQGGLLEHVYETLALSKPIFNLFPEIDRGLLTAGILLHDLGKLEEYHWQPDIEMTDDGRLLGHVMLGAEMVAAAIEKISGFPKQLATCLQHMMLSHHGRYDWGSPRLPMTLEAAALHHLENMDAQLSLFRVLLREAKEQGKTWTRYQRLLQRSLFAPPETSDSPSDSPAEQSGE
ncbi:MAG: HD domain-containing protein [Anaerolineales bacterium]